ncbi:MAG: hypothetical protein ACEQSR_01150 [Candidatus Methylacidiphilales bacterium]
MLLTSFHFYNNKNYLYSKPIKGLQSYGVGYGFAFNGQEKDDEVSGAGNTMTAEHWEYDSRLGRRWNVDPKPITGLSLYACFANNPIWLSDINGDTAIVISAPKGAGGAGHLALLIQNKEGKWALWSKNGTPYGAGIYGPTSKYFKKPNLGTKVFNSPEEFFNDDDYNPKNKETGEREYTEGFVIPMTSAEDRLAENGVKKELWKDEKKYKLKDYFLLGSMCAKMVQSGLDEAGFNNGDLRYSGRMSMPWFKLASSKTPNMIYSRIKQQNPNGYVWYAPMKKVSLKDLYIKTASPITNPCDNTSLVR